MLLRRRQPGSSAKAPFLSRLTSVGRLGRHSGRSADEVERADERVAATLQVTATDALDGREKRLEISFLHHTTGSVELLLDVVADAFDENLLLVRTDDNLKVGILPDHAVAIWRQLRTGEDELLVRRAVEDRDQRRRRLESEPKRVGQEPRETIDLVLEFLLRRTNGDLHIHALSAPEYRDIGLVSYLMRQGNQHSLLYQLPCLVSFTALISQNTTISQ